MYDPAHPFGRKAIQLAVIDPVSCTGCGWCAMFCPMKCIDQRPDGIYEVLHRLPQLQGQLLLRRRDHAAAAGTLT